MHNTESERLETLRKSIANGLKEALKSDPKTKAAWEQARTRLHAFNKACQEVKKSPEYCKANDAEQQKWHDLAEAGCSIQLPPKTLDDWIYLARMTEIPFGEIQRGDFTLDDINEHAKAKVEWEKIKPAKTPAPPAENKKKRKRLAGIQVDIWNILEKFTSERDDFDMPKVCMTAKEIEKRLREYCHISNQTENTISRSIQTIKGKGWPIENQRGGVGYYIGN